MGRRGKKYSSEEIITKLRKGEILSAQGSTQADICIQLGVPVDTYIRWKKEYSGMRVEQAKKGSCRFTVGCRESILNKSE